MADNKQANKSNAFFSDDEDDQSEEENPLVNL